MADKKVGGSVFDPQGVPYTPFAGDDGTGAKGMKGVTEQTSGDMTEALRKASMGRSATAPFKDDSFKQ